MHEDYTQAITSTYVTICFYRGKGSTTHRSQQDQISH